MYPITLKEKKKQVPFRHTFSWFLIYTNRGSRNYTGKHSSLFTCYMQRLRWPQEHQTPKNCLLLSLSLFSVFEMRSWYADHYIFFSKPQGNYNCNSFCSILFLIYLREIRVFLASAFPRTSRLPTACVLESEHVLRVLAIITRSSSFTRGL